MEDTLFEDLLKIGRGDVRVAAEHFQDFSRYAEAVRFSPLQPKGYVVAKPEGYVVAKPEGYVVAKPEGYVGWLADERSLKTDRR